MHQARADVGIVLAVIHIEDKIRRESRVHVVCVGEPAGWGWGCQVYIRYSEDGGIPLAVHTQT